jgi:hypothetical protein
MGADIGIGIRVNRAKNANITAKTSQWRERHKIKHGLNLSEKSKHEKVMSNDEKETYNTHIIAIQE